jgi:antitoxin CptB
MGPGEGEIHFRRLRWRCRRGMRELDVLLMGFIDHDYAAASPAQKQAFERLLSLQDPEIQALLVGRLPVDDPALDALVQRLLHHTGTAV